MAAIHNFYVRKCPSLLKLGEHWAHATDYVDKIFKVAVAGLNGTRIALDLAKATTLDGVKATTVQLSSTFSDIRAVIGSWRVVSLVINILTLNTFFQKKTRTQDKGKQSVSVPYHPLERIRNAAFMAADGLHFVLWHAEHTIKHLGKHTERMGIALKTSGLIGDSTSLLYDCIKKPEVKIHNAKEFSKRKAFDILTSFLNTVDSSIGFASQWVPMPAHPAFLVGKSVITGCSAVAWLYKQTIDTTKKPAKDTELTDT